MTKTKLVEMAPPAEKASGIVSAELLDRFGDLAERRLQFAPTEAAYQKTRSEILAKLEAEPADKTFALRGSRFRLDISAKANQCSFDIAAIRKILGADKFLQCCSVTKKALENFLLKPDIEKLSVTAQTGSRSLTSTAIAVSKDSATG